MHDSFFYKHLTLCHPWFWILVITRGAGGPQDPQLYFGILGGFMPPCNKVETHIEKRGSLLIMKKKEF